MAKLKISQILPSTLGITDENTKAWAKKLTFFFELITRKIAAIPFNRSESLECADTGDADTEFSLTHHLGKVPAGFLLTFSDAACSIYDSGSDWTTTTIYLKCNVANVNIKLRVF